MNAGDVVVRLTADLKDLQKGLTQAANLVKGFASASLAPLRLVESAVGKIFSLQNVVVGSAIGVTIKKVIDIGVEAEQTEKRFDLAFGNMAGSVRAWSEELGTRLKRSTDDIRGGAANLNLFIKSSGLTEQAAAALTKSLTELSYASVASGRAAGTEADLLWAMQQALMGNERSIKAYGVSVSEDLALQWAHRHGVDATTKSLNEEQLVVARAGVVWDSLKGSLDAAQASQEKTPVLLQQTKDAWKALFEETFKKWQPTIDAVLKGMRDWLIDNQDSIIQWASEFGKAAMKIVEALRGTIQFLSTEWQTGWTQTGKAVEATFQATLDILAILTEDAMLAIGKNMPIWLVKGWLLSVQATWKMWGDIGAKLAEEIRRGINAGMKFVFGPEVEQLTVRAQDIASNAAGATAKKVAARYGELTKQLAEMVQEQSRFAQKIKSDWEDIGTVIGKQVMEDWRAKWEQAGQAMQQAGEVGVVAATKVADATGKATQAEQGLVEALKEASHRSKQQIQDVQVYFANLEQEEEILRKISQGLYDEAEMLKIVNELKGKGIILTDAEKDRIQKFADNRRLVKVWDTAAKSISGSIEDAFVSMTDRANSFKDVMLNLANAIRESFARAFYQATIGKGIESMVGNLVGSIGLAMAGGAMNTTPLPSTGIGGGSITPATGSPGTMFASRGGIVRGPVYAASGFWKPRGTDTVPAMLTPGEAVLDRTTAGGLQRIFGAGGQGGDPKSVGLLQELVYQTKQVANKDQNVVIIDRRENTAEVLSRDARRRGPLTRGRT